MICHNCIPKIKVYPTEPSPEPWCVMCGRDKYEMVAEKVAEAIVEEMRRDGLLPSQQKNERKERGKGDNEKETKCG